MLYPDHVCLFFLFYLFLFFVSFHKLVRYQQPRTKNWITNIQISIDTEYLSGKLYIHFWVTD